MEAQLVGDKIDTVSSHHVEAVWAMFTMRATPKISENPMARRANTLPLMRPLTMMFRRMPYSLKRRIVKISPCPSFPKEGIIPPFIKERLGGFYESISRLYFLYFSITQGDILTGQSLVRISGASGLLHLLGQTLKLTILPLNTQACEVSRTPSKFMKMSSFASFRYAIVPEGPYVRHFP